MRLTFDPSSYAEGNDGEGQRPTGGSRKRRPMPDGEYRAMIIDEDYRANSKGTGHFLEFKFQVTEPGEFDGRWIWDYLNLDNPSNEAEDIAKRTLAKIAEACGRPNCADTTELHLIDLIIVVEQEMYHGEVKNRIVGYHRANVTHGGGQRRQPSKREPDPREEEHQRKRRARQDMLHDGGTRKSEPERKRPEAYGLDSDIPF